MNPLPPDLEDIEQQLIAAQRDAAALVSGVGNQLGGWSPTPGEWSIAECIDHLAVTNRVYLDAMSPALRKARREGNLRRGPLAPGVLGGTLAWFLEPPIRPLFKAKAPAIIRPRVQPPLDNAWTALQNSNEELMRVMREYANLDLASCSFPNPFISGITMNVAAALYIIASHSRRHIWQGWQVRHAAEARGFTTAALAGSFK